MVLLPCLCFFISFHCWGCLHVELGMWQEAYGFKLVLVSQVDTLSSLSEQKQSQKVKAECHHKWSYPRDLASTYTRTYIYIHTHAHICTCTDSASTYIHMYTHVHTHTQVQCQMCHLLPVLESGLLHVAQTALVGCPAATWMLWGKIEGDIQDEDHGHVMMFLWASVGSFLRKGETVYSAHIGICSGSRSRKAWHNSLQSQSNCMIRDLALCIYFKTCKKKLYSKINMKLQSNFTL